ncbi:MAG: SIR2 family protein [Elusimicrobia bacterium]|nr:SIR2 family protein [Elusimicrobiota bacterium]
MNSVLLTGAGFTYSLTGTYLAKDIKNHLITKLKVKDDAQEVLKELNMSSYEVVYQMACIDKSIKGGANLAVAMHEVYGEMEGQIVNNYWAEYQKNQNDIKHPQNKFKRFLSKCIAKNQEFYFFTTNQDRFIESSVFGIDRYPNHNYLGLIDNDIDKMKTPDIKLKKVSEIINKGNKIKSIIPYKISENFHKTPRSLNYVKLHGSYLWYDYNDTNVMVIGSEKTNAIKKWGLLKYYFDVFGNEISRPNTSLITIGYSFGDVHINEIIASAIDKHGLSLIIFNPILKDELNNKIGKNSVSKGLKAHYQDFKEVLVNDKILEMFN